MQEAEFHVPALPSCGTLSGGSSSTVEPSRWWTYAALMHAIITFISWRWHVTSSGLRAIMEAGSVAFFLSTVPKPAHIPNCRLKKDKSISFKFSKLCSNKAKMIERWQWDTEGTEKSQLGPARPVTAYVSRVSCTAQFSGQLSLFTCNLGKCWHERTKTN